MPLLLVKPASLPTCALTSPQQSQTYFYLNWPKLHVTNASEGSEQCPGFWWDLCCITTYLPVSLPHKSQTYFYLYLHIFVCQLDLSCILQQCAPKSHLSYLLHASEYCTCPCTFTHISYIPPTCESTWTFLHSPDPQVTWATSCLHMSATWLCFWSQCIAFVKVTALPLAYHCAFFRFFSVEVIVHAFNLDRHVGYDVLPYLLVVTVWSHLWWSGWLYDLCHCYFCSFHVSCITNHPENGETWHSNVLVTLVVVLVLIVLLFSVIALSSWSWSPRWIVDSGFFMSTVSQHLWLFSAYLSSWSLSYPDAFPGSMLICT